MQQGQWAGPWDGVETSISPCLGPDRMKTMRRKASGPRADKENKTPAN